MAIDIQQEQEQLQRPPRQEAGPAPRTPKRGAWAVVLGVTAIVAVVGTAVLVLQEDTAPVGGTVLTYQEAAFTAQREGGEYVVVPDPVASYTDTSVGIREGTAGAATTSDLGEMQQKAGMAEAGITGLGGAPVATPDLGAMQQKAGMAEAGITGLGDA